MPKSNPPDTNRHRQETPARRGPGAASLLLFWPFHLFNLLTCRLGTLPKLGARLVGYPFVAGIYGLAFLAIIYGIRALFRSRWCR